MKKCLTILTICWCVFGIYTSHSSHLEVINQWNLLAFDLPYNVGYGNIKLENTVFTGLEVADDRLFIATPRLRDGVPATLSFIPRDTPLGSSPVLRAYPDWSMHGAISGNFNCTGLISVYRIKADSCNRLWVLDSGVMSSIDDFRTVCQPKLIVFDLDTDHIARTVIFPREVIRPGSLLTNLIIDEESQGSCDSAFVYISDTTSPGLIVYDGLSDRAWRMSDPTFYPDPDFSDYNIDGEMFTLMDGIVGMAHSPYLNTLFFQPLATDRIFSIPTSRLTRGPQGEFESLPISLVGRKSSQGLGLAVNIFDDTLYFSPMTETSVASYNLVTNRQKLLLVEKEALHIVVKAGYLLYGAEIDNSTVLAYDRERLQFLAEMLWKDDGSLWMISTRFQKFFKRTISPSEINLRIVRIPPSSEVYRKPDSFIYY